MQLKREDPKFNLSSVSFVGHLNLQKKSTNEVLNLKINKIEHRKKDLYQLKFYDLNQLIESNEKIVNVKIKVVEIDFELFILIKHF